MASTKTKRSDIDLTPLNDRIRLGDRVGNRVVVVRVPGSRRSPDNRSFAVASDRWLTATFTLDGSRAKVIERSGTLRALTIAPNDDRLLVAFRAACIRAGRDVPDDLRIRVSSEVEVGRGLGASAAAAVAGALGARALLDLPLDDHALISAASTADGSIAQVVASFEGHTCVFRGERDADRTIPSTSYSIRPVEVRA